MVSARKTRLDFPPGLGKLWRHKGEKEEGGNLSGHVTDRSQHARAHTPITHTHTPAPAFKSPRHVRHAPVRPRWDDGGTLGLLLGLFDGYVLYDVLGGALGRVEGCSLGEVDGEHEGRALGLLLGLVDG